MVNIVDQKRAGRIQRGQELVRVKQEGHGMYILGKRII